MVNLRVTSLTSLPLATQGPKNLEKWRAEGAAHPIEETGKTLRDMMPWIAKGKLVKEASQKMAVEDIKISTKEDFIFFLSSLREDLKEGEEWENSTLENFLEAISAYIEDADVRNDLQWSSFARILLSARVYE